MFINPPKFSGRIRLTPNDRAAGTETINSRPICIIDRGDRHSSTAIFSSSCAVHLFRRCLPPPPSLEHQSIGNHYSNIDRSPKSTRVGQKVPELNRIKNNELLFLNIVSFCPSIYFIKPCSITSTPLFYSY